MSKHRSWAAAELHPKAKDLFALGDSVTLSETDSQGTIVELGHYCVLVRWDSGYKEWCSCAHITKKGG